MTDTNSALTEEQILRSRGFNASQIWLPAMSLHLLRNGVHVIEGRTFTECQIDGPAVMMPVGGVQFNGCAMGLTSDPISLLLKPMGSSAAGVIAVKNCTFERCRFNGIGFAGDDAFVETFKTIMSQPGAVQ